MMSVCNVAFMSMKFEQNFSHKCMLKGVIWTENLVLMAIFNLCKLNTFAYLDCSIFLIC